MKGVASCLAALCVVGFSVGAQTASADTGSGLTPSFAASSVATCGGSTDVTVTLDAQNPPAVAQAADIELVVDASGSIGSSVFASQVKPSLDAFITAAAPSATGNHIGIVEFSTAVTNVTDGGLLTDASTLESAVNGMPYTAGYTSTLSALEAAATALASGNGARAGVPKVIVVETDGRWNPATTQDPTAYAKSLTAAGTQIFAVGVGVDVDSTDLTAIAGGDATHVFQVANYSGLSAALQQALLEAVPAATNLTYAVTSTPGWTITGGSASAGDVTVSPSGLSWSLPKVDSPTATSVTISYTEQHTGTTGGAAVPLASRALLGYTDDAGTAQTVDYSGETVEVDGCNAPPVANAGPDQTVQLQGSHTASVTLDGSGSTDDGQLQPLTYTWSEDGTTLATGPDPTVALPIGSHTLTLTVFDGQYSSSDQVVVDVVDPTPPAIVPTISGVLGTNGWYTSDVTVSWSVTDPESAITTSSGCTTSSVTSDTPGTTFVCSATSAGGTSTVSTPSIARDATAPTVVYSGDQGTYGVADTVSIGCQAHDDLSGVASTTCASLDVPASTLAPGVHTLSATATDRAGNTGSGSASFTVVVRSADVCTLVDQWTDGAGVAHSLCVKLDHGSIGAFVNEVKAQRGKKIDAAHADVLIRLAAEL